MNLLFSIKSMTCPGGGAERVLADVANGLVRRGHKVSIISFDKPGGTSFYPLDPAIRRIDLGIGSVTEKATLWPTLRRIVALRQRITAEVPDIAIGFMHSMFIPLGIALIGTGIPIIASEHIVPEHYRSRPLEAFLLTLTPYLVERITCVSEQVVKAYPTTLQRKMTAVQNPIILANEGKADVLGGERKVLLSVGRLEEQKDHATLIKAFARLSQSFPDWDLRIIGEGSLHRDLERQVVQSGLAGRVFLPGAIKAIQAEYLDSQLFVLSSRYESFGLSVAEALGYGLPAVGFEDCAGVNLLIQTGVNGALVSSRGDRVLALAETLEPLMRDAALRQKLAAYAPASVEEYQLDRTLDSWERLITTL